MNDVEAITRLLEALRPWHDELVVVGGWAHRLHRLRPEAHEPTYVPLRTRDADIAFNDKQRLSGDIGEALKAAGFQKVMRGDTRPPVIHYHLGEEDLGFYAEFLVPLLGPSTDRGGAQRSTVATAGISAQRLRHLDLLLIHPWSISLRRGEPLPLQTPAIIRLPNPVTFIAQKILIRERREPDKQAQDVLYIHDTLELFADRLEELRNLWRDHIRPELMRKLAKRITRLSREQFEDVTDVIRSAGRIPQDRSLTAEGIRAACAYGLDAIFDET